MKILGSDLVANDPLSPKGLHLSQQQGGMLQR